MSAVQGAAGGAGTGNVELDYVKQLTSLILTRMEDKHRNITEVFRYMD